MKELFSERYKYVSKELQYEFINNRTKNFLWDELSFYCLNDAYKMFYGTLSDEPSDIEPQQAQAHNFYYDVYRNFFGVSMNNQKIDADECNKLLSQKFFDSKKWYNCFDVIEAVIQLLPELTPNKKKREIQLKKLMENINKVFDDERCSYRIVEGLIVPNTSDIDITAISDALIETNSIKTVNDHLYRAIKHYSDRNNPDLKNAMKESLAALESLLKLITGKPSIIMSDALKLIGKNKAFDLHPVLHLSLDKLYAWSSDASGIRHSNKGTSEPDYDIEDAKLVIVTCCSFVNYLISKSSKAGIKLE